MAASLATAEDANRMIVLRGLPWLLVFLSSTAGFGTVLSTAHLNQTRPLGTSKAYDRLSCLWQLDYGVDILTANIAVKDPDSE